MVVSGFEFGVGFACSLLLICVACDDGFLLRFVNDLVFLFVEMVYVL